MLIYSRETCKDFAVIVIIGAKLKVFRINLSSPLDVPLVKDLPIDKKELRKRKYLVWRVPELQVWKDIGIDIGGLEKKVSWVPIDEMMDGRQPEATNIDDVAPLDVLNPEDRPSIEKAFRWIAEVANSKGPTDSEHRL